VAVLVDHRGAAGPQDPAELAEDGLQVLDVPRHVPAPDQVDAAVRFGQPLRDALIHADAGGDLGLGGGQGVQGTIGIIQMAARRLDAVHGEPEPARQLDAVPGLAGSDVHGERSRRQAKPGDQVEQQGGAARGEAVVQSRLERLILGEGRPVAVKLVRGGDPRRGRHVSHRRSVAAPAGGAVHGPVRVPLVRQERGQRDRPVLGAVSRDFWCAQFMVAINPAAS